jgi:hypothetical protein
MADDWGLMENWEEYPICPHCEEPMDWEDCDLCGGEGEFDWERLQEEDPLWYQPGDVEKCTQCNGAGGWEFCSNPRCPAKMETNDGTRA